VATEVAAGSSLLVAGEEGEPGGHLFRGLAPAAAGGGLPRERVRAVRGLPT
jgi:hypothetical protein